MTSNQDSKEKEIRIPMTGIKVMKELSLDAPMMLYLASEEKLMPFRPGIPAHFFKKTMLDQRHLNEQVSNWWYWKSDVEAFKLEHKEFLEKIRLENAITPVESQKQGPPESDDPVSIGKNGGEQSKKGRSRSSDDRELEIPAQTGHRFRVKSATHSGVNRPPVPIQIGRAFRTKSATPMMGEVTLDN